MSSLKLWVTGSTSGDTEWFVDVAIPMGVLRQNDGCYSAPGKLTDTETFTAGTFLMGPNTQVYGALSTSNSNTNPLQKDTTIYNFSDTRVESLPVTVAYLYARPESDTLSVDWSTATETSNVGFNIYGVIGDDWVKLNDSPIAGALDSLEPLDYNASVPLLQAKSLDGVGIAGVDINGREDRHGPFPLNEAVGSRPSVSAIDWNQVRGKMDKAMKTRKVRPGTAAHLDVTTDGLYRLTDADLQAIGFHLKNVAANHIAISFRGEAVARHIGGLNKKGRWGAESWLEFMGAAPTGKDAIYLNASRYQLSRDRALVETAAPFEVPSPGALVVENNNQYAFSLPGEDPWYDAFFYARGVTRPAQLSRTFDLPGINDGVSELTVYALPLTTDAHHMVITINGVEVADASTSGRLLWPISFTVEPGILQEFGNTMTLRLPGDVSAFDYVVYDKLVVDYPNDLPGTIYSPPLALAESADRKRLATGRADLIVISHPSLMGPALDEYVAQREAENWQVKLVDVYDIYSAYGYGMATPDAIVDFLRDARKTGYSHVQLVGAASYDYRNFLGLDSVSFIPSIYVQTAMDITFTPCDTCFVLDDRELPTTAIGRWPVRSQSELEAVLRKGRIWDISQVGMEQALLIADSNEAGNNFIAQLEQTAEKIADTYFRNEPVRIYLDDEIAAAGSVNGGVSSASADIAKTLEEGASITVFSGHGSPSTWSFKGLLRQQDIAALNNSDQPTLALPLTCYTTYAESPYTRTLAHQLMAAGENGAVAVFGAATLSNYWQNGALMQEVLDGLLNGDSLGTSILAGKNRLGPAYRNVILNSNLLGDVTLQLR